MKYKYSKLAIGLAAVCAFSGQALANSPTSPASAVWTVNDSTPVPVSSIALSSTADNLDGTFGASFAGFLSSSAANKLTDTFKFNSPVSGLTDISATTTSKTLKGLLLTLTDLNTQVTWTSSSSISGSATTATLTTFKLNSTDTYSLVVSDSDVNSKGLPSYSGNYGGSITITPVPEPETYGMMLMGLGLMGFMVRRRRNDEV